MVAMAATEATTEEEVSAAAAVAGPVESAMTGKPGTALAERAAGSLTEMREVLLEVTPGPSARGESATTSRLASALAERAAASLTLLAGTMLVMTARPASIRQPCVFRLEGSCTQRGSVTTFEEQ